jgi:transposase
LDDARAAEVLSLIGQLYAIEADLPQPHVLQGEQQAAATAQRLAVRQEKSAPLVAAIREWALAQRSLPGSAPRKALGVDFRSTLS